MKNLRGAFILAMGAFFIQCQQGDKGFLITSDSVGKLHRSTAFSELDVLFASDSVVKDTIRIQLGTRVDKVRVFEKGGIHLLTLTVSTDSIPRVENVRIHDPRFVTDKGVGLNSTFKDIKGNYPIKKIVTSMNNIVVFLKGNGLYFTIDKQELPPNLRFANNVDIEEVQIPDAAKIKYLMIGWE